MAIISKNTQMRIDGTREGMTRISTSGGEFLVSSFDVPFYKLVLTEQPEEFENLSADDWTYDDVKTVETWAKNNEWKGKCPCSNANNAFEEGYGPWFFAPSEITAYTQAELDAETEEYA